MGFDFRSKYKLGKSTLQGGGNSTINQSTIIKAISDSTIPDFQAKAVNSIFPYSYDVGAPYEDPYYGGSIYFNQIDIDSFQLLRYTPDIVGEYYEIRIGDFYGITPEGTPYDFRVGVYRIGFFVNLERNPIGSRVATIVGTCYDGNEYRWAYDEPIWTTDAIASPDGSGILRIESADIEVNLLKIRRNAIKFNQERSDPERPFDFTNPILAVNFRIFQNCGEDLSIGRAEFDGSIYGAKIWFKYHRPGLTVDPDQYVGEVEV